MNTLQIVETGKATVIKTITGRDTEISLHSKIDFELAEFEGRQRYRVFMDDWKAYFETYSVDDFKKYFDVIESKVSDKVEDRRVLQEV